MGRQRRNIRLRLAGLPCLILVMWRWQGLAPRHRPACCHAFAPPRPRRDRLASLRAAPAAASTTDDAKSAFLRSLDPTVGRISAASPVRTRLLNNVLLEGGNAGLANPGSASTFAPVAPGTWRVVYAPHISTAAGWFRGKFSVRYDLTSDGTIVSHARYDFPSLGLRGHLSVSGTYGSVNERVCRVDFDEAWVKPLGGGGEEGGDDDDGPYPNVESVPESAAKAAIRSLGRALFIEPFAVFPVSYLDEDLIVFDFELLGTRICARRYDE